MRFVVSYLMIGLSIGMCSAEERIQYLIEQNSHKPAIEWTAEKTTLEVGEPFTFKLTYKYDKPRLPFGGNEPRRSIGHDAYLQISDSDSVIIAPLIPVFPGQLSISDTEGLVYRGDFSVLYNVYGKKGILFEEPGEYEVCLLYSDSKVLDPLVVTVTAPSQSTRKAMALMSDPNDYMFIEFGVQRDPEQRPRIIEDLTRAAEQCGDSLLGRMAAARLGIEYYKTFQKNLSRQYEAGVDPNQFIAEDESYQLASKYLRMAVPGLRNGMPIHEEALWILAPIEYQDGNRERAIALVRELSANYPYGEYGRHAGRTLSRWLDGEVALESANPSVPADGATSRVLLISILAGLSLLAVSVIFLVRSRKQ